jgi:hypothetical protein
MSAVHSSLVAVGVSLGFRYSQLIIGLSANATHDLVMGPA